LTSSLEALDALNTKVYENMENKISEQIKTELKKRCARNPNYSLRSFAKAVGISHSLLSLVVSGKRPASLKLQEAIRKHLAPVQESSSKFREIDPDDFSEIATWKHYAVLGLTHIKNFQFNISNVSKSLKLSKTETKMVIDDLVKYRFLSSQGKKWYQSTPPITVTNHKPIPACSEFIRGYLKKAEQSMDTVPFEERALNNITFAMNVKDVEYAREQLRNFRRKLCHELENRNEPNVVMTIGTQLFPLTEKIS